MGFQRKETMGREGISAARMRETVRFSMLQKSTLSAGDMDARALRKPRLKRRELKSPFLLPALTLSHLSREVSGFLRSLKFTTATSGSSRNSSKMKSARK